MIETNKSYTLGTSLTIEALKRRPECLDVVYLSSKAHKNEQLDYLLTLCGDNNVKVVEDDRIIEKYSLKENCYAIGMFNRFECNLTTDKHIVLYEINDIGQLGTILRSAVSFDFNDVILINCDIDYFDPRVVRASMGAIFHLGIKKYDTIDDYLRDYKYHLYPFVNNGKKELSNINFKTPFALVISENDKLKDIFFDNYYVFHHGEDELSLSALSSIVFNYCFENLKR